MKTKVLILSVALGISVLTANFQSMEKNPNTNTSFAPVESLELTQEWDKVFPKSEKSRSFKGCFRKPIRYHACCRYV